MSTEGREPGEEDAPRRAAAPSWRAAWPFFVALGIVVLAGVGIGISYLIRPAEDRMSESALVQHAINEVYTARNELDYERYVESTCPAVVEAVGFPSSEQFVSDNRRSREANGHIVIPEITEISIDGDRASAQVHWHFDDHPDQDQTTRVVLVDDGDWKVCNS